MKLDSAETVGLFKWVLGSWRRLGMLVVLTVFAGFSYFVWEEREKISSAAASRWANPEIIEERLPDVVAGLTTELNPKTIYVWSANVAGNTRRPIYVWIDGVRRPELEGKVEMLFPDDSQGIGHVARLIKGQEFCEAFEPRESIREAVKQANVNWWCVVGIPPEMTTLIGAITVGFSEQRPEDFSEIQASVVRWAQYSTGRTW
ncbi:MAG TPA: hypothetical protein VNV36_23145 [Pseudomonas sp.]|uniref:hypothetical protein n=1 Tax=Pseudomonas sp. TaxID=306 RepID=UPI002C3FF63D|nr:hypothetical protein [Pseudomonas sp.]HWH89658.1 hypothetical protein [Pseudomonas sp.]